MSTEFSKIISGVSRAKAQARQGRKTAPGQTRGKIGQIPDYEDIANWRGIESALDAIKFDHASKPGADVPHRLAIDATEGASPHEIIGQHNQSLFTPAP